MFYVSMYLSIYNNVVVDISGVGLTMIVCVCVCVSILLICIQQM